MVIVNGMPKSGTHAVMAWLADMGLKRRPGTILPAPMFKVRAVGVELEAIKRDFREGMFVLAHVPASRSLWAPTITVFRDPRNMLVSYCRHRMREDNIGISIPEAIRDYWGQPFVPTYISYLPWRGLCTTLRYEDLRPSNGARIYEDHPRDWNTYTGCSSNWRDVWDGEAEDAWQEAGGPELLNRAGYGIGG